MRVLTRWKAVLGGLLVLLSLCALRAGAPLSAAAETAAPAETVPAPEEPEQLPLTVGAMSRDVRKAKERLQSLRYFRAKQLNAHYTEEVAEAVRLFQRINGLPETGEVDRATWDLLFSGAAEDIQSDKLIFTSKYLCGLSLSQSDTLRYRDPSLRRKRARPLFQHVLPRGRKRTSADSQLSEQAEPPQLPF